MDQAIKMKTSTADMKEVLYTKMAFSFMYLKNHLVKCGFHLYEKNPALRFFHLHQKPPLYKCGSFIYIRNHRFIKCGFFTSLKNHRSIECGFSSA